MKPSYIALRRDELRSVVRLLSLLETHSASAIESARTPGTTRMSRFDMLALSLPELAPEPTEQPVVEESDLRRVHLLRSGEPPVIGYLDGAEARLIPIQEVKR